MTDARRGATMLTRRSLAVAATLFAVACAEELQPSATIAATTVCAAYPVPWVADTEAESAARAELAGLDGDGSLTWAADRGTPQSVSLDVPLRCVGRADVVAAVRGFLAEHPKLFHFDDHDWRAASPFECRRLGAEPTSFTLARAQIGEHQVRKDILSFDVTRVRGKVRLVGVQGFYLPGGSEASAAGVDEQLAACAAQTPEAIEGVVRATSLGAIVYDQCVRQGTISYQPRPNDVVTVDQVEWDWADGSGETQLFGTRRVRVTLDPANYTPELLSSSARCLVLDVTSEDFTVGFDVFVDVNTGEVQFVVAGLDCIVC